MCLQMVSLLHLANITEEGVQFASPVDGSMMMLTPEHSMAIQNKLGALTFLTDSLPLLGCTWYNTLEGPVHQTLKLPTLHTPGSRSPVAAAGADIIMALDDVVSSINTSPERWPCHFPWHACRLLALAHNLGRVPFLRKIPALVSCTRMKLQHGHLRAWEGGGACRFEEATHRTTRWIDRCIKTHGRPTEQSLFGIVQGGLDPDLRHISIRQLSERDLPGYAIGGLAGGEDKSQFCR